MPEICLTSGGVISLYPDSRYSAGARFFAACETISREYYSVNNGMVIQLIQWRVKVGKSCIMGNRETTQHREPNT